MNTKTQKWKQLSKTTHNKYKILMQTTTKTWKTKRSENAHKKTQTAANNKNTTKYKQTKTNKPTTTQHT